MISHTTWFRRANLKCALLVAVIGLAIFLTHIFWKNESNRSHLDSIPSATLAPRPQNSVFAGLDRDTINEVLGNSATNERILEAPESLRAVLWQGMVRNFYLCRSTYNAYSKLLSNPNNAPVSLPNQPSPSFPLTDTKNDELGLAEAEVRNLLRASDLLGLRNFLTVSTGCGSWIPISASDQRPISQAVATS